MLKTFAGIVIILLTVGVYGSTDYQPTTFIKDTKLIGSLHQNNEVEMFLGNLMLSRQLMNSDGKSLLLGLLKVKKK